MKQTNLVSVKLWFELALLKTFLILAHFTLELQLGLTFKSQDILHLMQ